MKIKVVFGLLVVFLALAGGYVLLMPKSGHYTNEVIQVEPKAAAAATDTVEATTYDPIRRSNNIIPQVTSNPIQATSPQNEPVITNKLERLTKIRETFRALATGDRATAMRAAKQITDPTERETALFTLVTEWTGGELGPPVRRARAIAAYGLEGGMAIELANNPELAILWANELTEGPARAAIIQQTAMTMLTVSGADPAAAFALSEQLPTTDRRAFYDALLSSWASSDTQAALDWANQSADPDEREAALRAIRSVAPVGIGAVLQVQDGYPTINQLLPGTAGERSGQLHPGDRILALAQGDNSFVDVHSLPLDNVVQMIRGAPNTVLQMQVLASDAPPNSIPRIVSIPRDQLKFKR